MLVRHKATSKVRSYKGPPSCLDRGFSDVFARAQVYAMKVLRKSRVLSSEKPHQVLSERSVLELVQHPFVVKLFMAFQVRKVAFFQLARRPLILRFLHSLLPLPAGR